MQYKAKAIFFAIKGDLVMLLIDDKIRPQVNLLLVAKKVAFVRCRLNLDFVQVGLESMRPNDFGVTFSVLFGLTFNINEQRRTYLIIGLSD